MTFDPKTALGRCETLMLDMDGTVLDLAYDNYMWMTHVPEQWGVQNGMTLDEARKQLFARFGEARGELHWYCLDHWSANLNLDVLQLHRDNHERIGFLPGAREFLQQVRDLDIKVLLVTNSHPDTLQLKEEVTGLCEFFDSVHSAHSYGHAKEKQDFWHALQQREQFDPATTMFVDDTVRVLASAVEYGIERAVAITRPDTSEPASSSQNFVAVEAVRDLL